jgi:hypothetical protein
MGNPTLIISGTIPTQSRRTFSIAAQNSTFYFVSLLLNALQEQVCEYIFFFFFPFFFNLSCEFISEFIRIFKLVKLKKDFVIKMKQWKLRVLNQLHGMCCLIKHYKIVTIYMRKFGYAY